MEIPVVVGHLYISPKTVLEVCVGQYQNNASTAVILMNGGETHAVVSVNVPQSATLPRGYFYGKHWSENDGLLQKMIDAGLIEEVPVMGTCYLGWVESRVYRLTSQTVCDEPNKDELELI